MKTLFFSLSFCSVFMFSCGSGEQTTTSVKQPEDKSTGTVAATAATGNYPPLIDSGINKCDLMLASMSDPHFNYYFRMNEVDSIIKKAIEDEPSAMQDHTSFKTQFVQMLLDEPKNVGTNPHTEAQKATITSVVNSRKMLLDSLKEEYRRNP